jgi:hypothetical protein
MKKKSKLLVALMLVIFSLFGQVLTASASVTGRISRVTSSSLIMRTDPGVNYGIVMTMSNGEAIAALPLQNIPADGYYWSQYLGWKSPIGATVSGYAVINYSTYVQTADAKWDLNLYDNDTTTVWSTVIPAGSTGLRSDNWRGNVVAYDNLKRIEVNEFTPPGGNWNWFSPAMYVNTKFQSNYPSDYYLVLH